MGLTRSSVAALVMVVACSSPGGESARLGSTSSALTFASITKLRASDEIPQNYFGNQVVTQGDTAMISALEPQNRGAVYVFERTGATWNEVDKLTASDGANGDSFGTALALSGETLLVGAPSTEIGTGAVYVFTRAAGKWTQQAKLVRNGGQELDSFGSGVGIDGDVAVIGASRESSQTGAAHVFTRAGTTWSEGPKLEGSDTAQKDLFGHRLAMSGDTVIIGAVATDQPKTGAAYVFRRGAGGTWKEEQKLAPTDGASGDLFSVSVAIQGELAMVGSSGHDTFRGAVYAYVRTGATWTLQQKLVPADRAPYDAFGVSIAIDGDRALLGGDGNRARSSLWARTGTTWAEGQLLTESDAPADNDFFGGSTTLSGDFALVSAYNKTSGRGVVYAYTTEACVPTDAGADAEAAPAPKNEAVVVDAGNARVASEATNDDGAASESNCNSSGASTGRASAPMRAGLFAFVALGALARMRRRGRGERSR